MEKIIEFWAWLTSVERVPLLAENWGWVVFLTGLGIWLVLKFLFFEDLGKNRNHIYRLSKTQRETGTQTCATCAYGGGGYCSVHCREIYEPHLHRCPRHTLSGRAFREGSQSMARDTAGLLDWLLENGVQTVAVTVLLLGLCVLNTYICLNQDFLDALADLVWRVTVTALVVVTLNANKVLLPGCCYEELREENWLVRLVTALVVGWLLAGIITLLMLVGHVAGTIAYVVLALGWKVVSFLISAFVQIVF